MKVIDIIETAEVINFAQHAHIRDIMKRNADAHARAKEIEREGDSEEQTVQELAEFEEWMNTAKEKGRIPGFDTMDDAVAYLIVDLEMPHHITHAKAHQWFKSLDDDQRSKAIMIAHHADRLINIYRVLHNKLSGIQNIWRDRFNGKIPHGWDATDGAAWLDQEFVHDIQQLNNLKKVVQIVR